MRKQVRIPLLKSVVDPGGRALRAPGNLLRTWPFLAGACARFLSVEIIPRVGQAMSKHHPGRPAEECCAFARA